MRIAVPEFGPMPMVEMRVASRPRSCAAADARHRGETFALLTTNWRGLAFVGITNSAIPFALFAYAMLSITSGFGAILNSTAPLFGAVIAVVWLRERMPWPRVAGLLIGFGGVALLVWGKPTFALGGDDAGRLRRRLRHRSRTVFRRASSSAIWRTSRRSPSQPAARSRGDRRAAARDCDWPAGQAIARRVARRDRARRRLHRPRLHPVFPADPATSGRRARSR